MINEGVVIGDGSRIGAQSTVSHAIVGNRVVLFPGVRIGQDGFGFATTMTPTGPRHVSVPQLGRVVIEDDVEIGANSSVDRGSAQDTVIGAGTRIDNLVQIGHNVKIGRACVIVAQSGVSGSAVLEDFVVLAGQDYHWNGWVFGGYFFQQFVDIKGDGVLSIAGFADRSGSRFVARGARKVMLRSEPAGVGVCFESVELDPALAEATARLCRHLGYFGVFEVEFIRCGNDWAAIDFNPRFYNQMGLDTARGIPLARLCYYDAIGDEARPSAVAALALPHLRARLGATGVVAHECSQRRSSSARRHAHPLCQQAPAARGCMVAA